jgi:hypothetical protein
VSDISVQKAPPFLAGKTCQVFCMVLFTSFHHIFLTGFITGTHGCQFVSHQPVILNHMRIINVKVVVLGMDYSFRIYDGAIILFKTLILLYINTESCLRALPHDGVFQQLHDRFNPNH